MRALKNFRMPLIKTPSFQLAVYANGDEKADKLALCLPGKLDTKDYAHMRSHVDYLAGLGYHAVTFDPPGTWESPGGIELYTMSNYLKAINELIEYYGNRPTLVLGHSRGATMSMLAGTSNPKIFAFIPIMSTLAKGSFWESHDPEWQSRGYTLSKRDLPPGGGPKVKEYKLPYSFFEDQTKYDLTPEMTSSTKPKLFILGKRDVLATPNIVKSTYATFAEPKQLYELDSDHDYRFHPTLIDEVNSVVGNFLKQL